MGELNSKIRNILLKEIDGAKKTIYLAVAYFSDMEVVNLLKKKAQEGVRVEVIVYDHPVNSPVVIEFGSQRGLGLFLYDSNVNPPIYPKFCIIDEEILITGDHGWAYAANKKEHPEPAIVNNESILIEEYLNKFNYFKEHCGSSEINKFLHFKIKP